MLRRNSLAKRQSYIKQKSGSDQPFHGIRLITNVKDYSRTMPVMSTVKCQKSFGCYLTYFSFRSAVDAALPRSHITSHSYRPDFSDLAIYAPMKRRLFAVEGKISLRNTIFL
jgi:hypothetical protein